MEHSGELPTTLCANWKGLVPVMHFCVCFIHCKGHWRVGRRLGLCRLTSAQPLIGSTIRDFSISPALFIIGNSALTIQTQFLSNKSQHIMVDGYLSKLVSDMSGVSQGTVLGPVLFLLYTSQLFSILENKLIGNVDDFTLMAVVLSLGIRVTVAESLKHDLRKVSEGCDLWEIKLNLSRTKTMIVSRIYTMLPSHLH